MLAGAGYAFDVVPADIDESSFPTMAPSELARQLALAKAERVAGRHPDAVVLGADTVVALGERVLGKPANADEAKAMLELLSGTTHLVITGLAAVRLAGPFSQSGRVMSAVRMRWLGRGEIDGYVASGQWEGKAGGYGIQDPDPFVVRMAGSHSNIVGLPLAAVVEMLSAAGVPRPERTAPKRDD